MVPDYADSRIEPGVDPETIDRSDWDVVIWIAGAAVRMAEGAERERLLIPWTNFPIGDLDLWLEQDRCQHSGLPVPTELSEPEESIDFSNTDSTTTKTGLVLIRGGLAASAREAAGKQLLRVEVATGSTLERAGLDAGHEPKGYFLAALAAYVTGGVQELAPDPEGDGVPFLREELVAATSKTDQLPQLIRRAESEGVEFDD